jgi:hypothetical protein
MDFPQILLRCGNKVTTELISLLIVDCDILGVCHYYDNFRNDYDAQSSSNFGQPRRPVGSCCGEEMLDRDSLVATPTIELIVIQALMIRPIARIHHCNQIALPQSMHVSQPTV